MRIVRNRGYGQNPVGMIKIFITPPPNQLGRIARFIIPQLSQWKMTRRSSISSPTQYAKIWRSSTLCLRIVFPRRLRHQRKTRKYGARRKRRHRPLLLLQVWMKRPQPDQVWKGPTFWTLNQELAWGRFPPLSQLYPFICFQ